MAKANLDTIDQKLNNLIELVQKHIERDERQFDKLWDHLDGNLDHPGLLTRIFSLEQTNREHKDHSKMIKTALVSAFIALVSSTVKWWVR